MDLLTLIWLIGSCCLVARGAIRMDAGFSVVFNILLFLFAFVYVISMFRLFKMANEPVWKAIIPIYNNWTLARIINLNSWTIICFYIPFVDFIYTILFMCKLANAYNRGILMRLALISCTPLAMFIMAFSPKTKYITR